MNQELTLVFYLLSLVAVVALVLFFHRERLFK